MTPNQSAVIQRDLEPVDKNDERDLFARSMIRMKTHFLAHFCATVLSVATPEGSNAADALPAPASATFISKDWGKPPMKFVRATLVLTNRHPSPLWFVLPYRYDEPPRLNNPLLIPEGFKPTMICAGGFNTGTYYKAVQGSKGKTIQLVVLHVTNDKAFSLFRLPPGGRVEFESYRFEMLSEYVRSFKVWVAEEITVNGTLPLQNWLPYETLSDAQTFVPANTQSDNLNWDLKLLGDRADFRKEPISKLDLKITGAWEVPFDNFK